MEHHKIDSEPRCPTCHKTLDGATGLHTDNKPSPGDVSFCLCCHEVLQFNDDLTLRVADPDVASEAMEQLQPAMQANRDNEFSRLDQCRSELQEVLKKYDVCGLMVIVDASDDGLKSACYRYLTPLKNKFDHDVESPAKAVADQVMIWHVFIKKLEEMKKDMIRDDTLGRFLKRTNPEAFKKITDDLYKNRKKSKFKHLLYNLIHWY